MLAVYEKAHIILTQAEKDSLEIADFGLDDIYHTGLEIVTYVNTDRCCAKEMVLLPQQTCPEHRHAPIAEKIISVKRKHFAVDSARFTFMLKERKPQTEEQRFPKVFIPYSMKSNCCPVNSTLYTLIPSTGFRLEKAAR